MESRSWDPGEAYLELLKDALLNLHYLEHEPITKKKYQEKTLAAKRARRLRGADWPAWAVTMVGRLRLDNIQHCLRTVVDEEIPGDFLETGVWRGGASIFARACLNVLPQFQKRTVWLADSFQGCPPPDPKKWPKDRGSKHSLRENFKVSLDEVKRNFKRFRVSLDGVRFLKGWFEETLPGPIERLSVLRIDGDMYGGTMHTLRTLYDRVSPGGFIISDDWRASLREKAAIVDFLEERKLKPVFTEIDWTCRMWRKT